MNLELDLQQATEATRLPAHEDFERWIRLALGDRLDDTELTIRLVDREESRVLNRDYRGKDSATNVLSFPFEAPPGIELNLLGDLVICVPVVVEEADAQHKPLDHHWAHLVIHGILHLLGHDHQNEPQGEAMEALETELLQTLGIPDPYQSH